MKKSLFAFFNFSIILGVFTFFISANNLHYYSPKQNLISPKSSDFKQKQALWADSVLATMTLEQKIGQLFMIAAFSNRNENDYRRVEEQIRKYHIGGVIFFQGNPLKQAELTNRYQSAATIPLLIGIDGEWGLGMRLDDAFSFPKAITLGATVDANLIEKMGFEIGKQCKRLGVHINFAPDADINSNPKNPVINYRSFGESVSNVTNLSLAYARGMRKANVMGSAKHFPGHGDTGEDSHYALPVLNHTRKHIDEVETMPFKAMIEDSIASVMIGHLHVPQLDNSPNTPASVSEKIIKEYLQRDMNFNGLVVTDALNMRGLLKYFPTGAAEVKAFQAGNDLLLQTGNLDVAYGALHQKILDSTLSVNDLDHKVKKVLMSKYWVGLNKYKPIDFSNLLLDLNNQQSKDLTQKIFDKAATVVKDDEGLIPLANSQNVSYASLSIAGKADNVFQKTMSYYSNITNYDIPFKPSKSSDWTWVVEQAAQKDLVIVGVHEMHNLDSRNFGVVPETIKIIRELQKQTKVVVCVFGNPYSLKLFDEFETVICGFEDEAEAHIAVANIIFGVNGASGKIPVNTLAADGKVNFGIDTKSLGRIGLGIASEVGMDQSKLSQIRFLANNAIENQEFPGCQVLLARKGKVVFFESFGNQRYGANEPVDGQTIFDLASLTKVTATLQAIMMLFDQKKLDINQKASFYLPELQNSNKKDITVKDLLLHQAGLKAFVPFYDNTIEVVGERNPKFFARENLGNSYLKVSDSLFVKPMIKDSVFNWIIKSSLVSSSNAPKYLYSDLGLILLQRVVEKVSGQPLDAYVDSKIFRPLGMYNTGFNISDKKSAQNIAPTEITNDYRKTPIKGSVHDPNAALLGGVAGHAGLFSNAWDLSKLLQMNLNKGFYEDNHFFSPQTIDLFIKKQSTISHRGLGWNKPSTDDGSVSQYASPSTYGHTGFTGTAVWVDPEKELIYIFLSNRVYPSAENNKIIKNKTRKRIHDLVYESMMK
jgi:beta-glucosidase-like glycosyl hydrolase/CubicO group peptidase (beta-lactamase class C family)